MEYPYVGNLYQELQFLLFLFLLILFSFTSKNKQTTFNVGSLIILFNAVDVILFSEQISNVIHSSIMISFISLFSKFYDDFHVKFRNALIAVFILFTLDFIHLDQDYEDLYFIRLEYKAKYEVNNTNRSITYENDTTYSQKIEQTSNGQFKIHTVRHYVRWTPYFNIQENYSIYEATPFNKFYSSFRLWIGKTYIFEPVEDEISI